MLSTIISILFSGLAFAAQNATLPVELIHQFPLGNFIENLVVRPSGSVLAIDDTQPHIFSVSIHANSTASLIHTFHNATGVSSITKSSDPDVYHVITSNFTWSTFQPVNKSAAIHRLSFDDCDELKVEQLALLPNVIMPNGMVTIPGTDDVLIADSIAGFIYRFNTETLELSVYFDDPLLKPAGTSLQAGINGLKFSRGYLYFSNTNQELVARIGVSGSRFTPQGTPQILATQTLADDFIVNDYNGDIFIAENGANELGFVKAGGNSTIPSGLTGGKLAGPTSAVWAKGEEGRALIVSTTGGVFQYISGNFTLGGAVNLVHVSRER